MDDRTCQRCGTTFQAENGTRGKWKRFCSSECAEAKPATIRPACSIDGCARGTRSIRGGLCEMHYYRVRRSGSAGDPDSRKQWSGTCRYAGCDRDDAGGDGWCTLHARRVRVHGDPDVVGRATPTPGEMHPQWQGDDIGYSGVHTRLRKDRGSASNYPCTDCGQPAEHWSYDHDDLNEKLATEGPYSTNLDHYSARCVPCHKRFDLARAAA